MVLGGSNFPSVLGFPAGLFRPGMSREGPGTGRDRTGPRDLEGPVVPWSRDQRSPKVPGLFLKVPGPSGPFFPLAYHEILKRPDQSVFLPDFSFLYVHSFLL